MQSAMEAALRKWDRCHEGFHGWLRMIMVTCYRDYKAAMKRGVAPPQRDEVEPTQEALLAASQALALCKEPEMVLAYAKGEDLSTIGARMGITKQRASIKIQEERKRMGVDT